MRWWPASLAALLATVVVPSTSAAADVLMAARPDANLGRAARLIATLPGRVSIYTWRGPGPVARAESELARKHGVLAVQRDEGLRRAQSSTVCTTAPATPDLSLASAVDASATPPSTTAPVAILDTGVDASVPELRGRLVSPFDALDGSSDASDSDGHGTGVAAVAAAAPGMFQGISPTSPIMPIRIYNVAGDTSAAILVKAIQQAVAAKATVINVSGANPATDVSSQDTSVVQLAIDSAFASGVITVVAAGNEGSSAPDVPADFPHVLTVGASAAADRAPFSNTGPWIDLISPGNNLTLPAPSGVCASGYATSSGTSFAAPAVAGAVARVRALRPSLSTEQVFQLIRTSARDLATPGRDDDTGYGMLDVQAAVNVPPPRVDATELDDDVFWLTGAYASKHPSLLKRGRVARVRGTVSPAKDPADVYPVLLRKGQTVTVRATASAAALIDLTLWTPQAGPFDVTNDVAEHIAADYNGFSSAPQISYRVRRGGRYFVSVNASDVPEQPTDPSEPPATTPDFERYLLTVSTSKPRPKRRPRSHRRKRA